MSIVVKNSTSINVQKMLENVKRWTLIIICKGLDRFCTMMRWRTNSRRFFDQKRHHSARTFPDIHLIWLCVILLTILKTQDGDERKALRYHSGHPKGFDCDFKYDSKNGVQWLLQKISYHFQRCIDSEKVYFE